MCGIAGILQRSGLGADAELGMRRMLASLRHRGPDQFGIYLGNQAVLGSVRLSILDLATGQQPIANEDETLWIVFNGEIFNYVELRPELEQRGHCFTTQSDTEVILHLYEESGPECLARLNGQFAIAIWDSRARTLFLARDRLGVRPLFYTQQGDALLFASEIKALLNAAEGGAQIDASSLLEVFTYWAPLPGRTAFRDIKELAAGHYLLARDGKISVRRYWQLDFPLAAQTAGVGRSSVRVEPYLEEFESLLVDAARLRLRADVPVGAYLSGGLDSSTIAAVVRQHTSNHLNTFSIAFTDADFDESEHQRRMAGFLGTKHQVVEATHADIGRVFPEVVWHAEVPILRTAPAPMFLLSILVRRAGFKVVLTGEGADEFLAGYDVFKEAKIRRFWARRPESRLRPLLLQRLYPEIFTVSRPSNAFLAAFFGEGLEKVGSFDYSHALRWRNGRRNWRFFSEETLAAARNSCSPSLPGLLPEAFSGWGSLAQAQCLEISLFLSQYLLCSQGDRMAMAHSVEGRFPFLDHRLVEFCNRLPPELKLRGLQEKYLLRRLARQWLPPEIWGRRKRPYRAPIHRSFFNQQTPDYVHELLSVNALKRSGFFKPAAVSQLLAKLTQGKPVGETDDMALAGILSTQLLHHQFVEHFERAAPLADDAQARVCRHATA